MPLIRICSSRLPSIAVRPCCSPTYGTIVLRLQYTLDYSLRLRCKVVLSHKPNLVVDIRVPTCCSQQQSAARKEGEKLHFELVEKKMLHPAKKQRNKRYYIAVLPTTVNQACAYLKSASMYGDYHNLQPRSEVIDMMSPLSCH